MIRYLNAPEPIRAAFDAEVAAWAKAETDYAAWLHRWGVRDEFGVLGVDDLGAPEPPRLRRRPRWDASWSRRAERHRKFGPEPTDDLREQPAEVYVTALTGTTPTAGRFNCPDPECSGQPLSARVMREDATRWACFRCKRGGSIYDFGAALWNIEPRGTGFREIRERISAGLGMEAAA